MKLGFIEIRIKVSKEGDKEGACDAILKNGCITLSSHYLPPQDTYTFNGMQMTEIKGYATNTFYTDVFKGRFNTSLHYGTKDIYLWTKLNWWQRQKLFLMMGDHIILNNGNFKWVIGTALTVIFFVYTARQNDKLVKANEENSKLKEQIHVLETKIALDKKTTNK